MCADPPSAAQTSDGSDLSSLIDRADDQTILNALQATADGFSIDEIIIDDGRRERFLTAIDPNWASRGDRWQTETLLRLISLRKAGKISQRTTQRSTPVHPSVFPVAEIAVRGVIDVHQVSTDRVVCDPMLRAQLQARAKEIASDVNAYEVRKSVLKLRKSRNLKPELVLRVTDWDRTIISLPLETVIERLKAGDDGENAVHRGAAVYLFRDRTGYLYIGEAANLRDRLKQHLTDSDRQSLRAYLMQVSEGEVTVELHLFDDESPAKQLAVRRAYESELIRTRHPRFNVRP